MELIFQKEEDVLYVIALMWFVEVCARLAIIE